MKPLRTAARGMLGAMFVVNGARAMAKPEHHSPQAKRITDWIAPVLEQASPRVPTDTRTLIRVNGAVQLAGGLLLARGLARRPAAAALAASLVPTTVADHPFWTYHDPQRRRGQQLHFLQNVSVVGGLLLAAADTEGRPGPSWRGAHLVQHTRRSARQAAQSARRQLRTARRQARTARRIARRQPVIARRAVRVGRFTERIAGRLGGFSG